MPAAKRRTRTPWKGRTTVAISLAVFVLVSVIVVWRRSIGVATAHEMRTLAAEKRSLLSQRTTLERELNDASSRSRIVAAAERRLGLRVAPESQTRSIADGSGAPVVPAPATVVAPVPPL